MSDFYARRLTPVGQEVGREGESLLKAGETALGGLNALEQKIQREKQTLQMLDYHREAQRNAMEAYELHSEDREAFAAEYDRRMDAIEVPLGLRPYVAQIRRSEGSRYYSTIFSQEMQKIRDAKGKTSLQLANTLADRGFMDLDSGGEFGATHGDLLAGVEQLFQTDSDGLPLIGEEERRGVFAGWQERGILSAARRSLLDSGGPQQLVQMIEALDGGEDVAVALTPEGLSFGRDAPEGVQGGSRPLHGSLPRTPDREAPEGAISFHSGVLEPGRKRRLRENMVELLVEKIKAEKAEAKANLAIEILSGEKEFLPGNADQIRALNYIAELRVAAHPITPENLGAHLAWARESVEVAGLLPTAYAGALRGMVWSQNPLQCANAAMVLERLEELDSPAVTRALDAKTVMKAQMVCAQVVAGTSPGDAVAFVADAMARFVRNPDEFEKELKRAKEELKDNGKGGFYGDQITFNNGYDAVARGFYERMVDSYFFINGGDRDSAVRCAQDAIGREFPVSRIGFYAENPRRVRNCPEAVYGSWVIGIVDEDLQRLETEIYRETGIPADLAHLMLVATPLTDAAIANGENPRWEIWRREDDGRSARYTTGDGKPMSYSVPTGTDEEIVKRELQRKLDLIEQRGNALLEGGVAIGGPEAGKVLGRATKAVGKSALKSAGKVIEAAMGLSGVEDSKERQLRLYNFYRMRAGLNPLTMEEYDALGQKSSGPGVGGAIAKQFMEKAKDYRSRGMNLEELMKSSREGPDSAPRRATRERRKLVEGGRK
jgi:hypothetical protein